MLIPVKKKRAYEDISAQIQKQILDGSWKEGDRIQGELELAQLFQVSRGSIREAIKSLQMMGVLEAQSGHGTFVSQNAIQKIGDNRLIEMINDNEYRDQVLECRYIIEPQAAFVAAQVCNDQDISYLRYTYEKMMEYSNQGNHKEMNRYGQLFHSYIVGMMKNEILSAIYKSIEQQLLDERGAFAESNETNVLLTFHEEHLDLINALQVHDAVHARKIMDQHLGRQVHWKRLKQR